MAKLSDIQIAGIETSPLGFSPGSAENIENLRYDEVLKCWVNDRALVPCLNPDSTVYLPTADIYSVYSYKPHGNYKEHILFEQLNGSVVDLKVMIGRVIHTLKTGRHLPSANEPSTQYIKFNDSVIILNGTNTPLVYNGGKYIREITSVRPSTVSISTPGMTVGGYGPEMIGLFTRYGMRTSGGSILQFGVESGYGLGLGARAIQTFDGTKDTFYTEQIVNTYEYVVTFITDTGSETAMSGRSSRVSFLGSGFTLEDDATPANEKVITARYAIALDDVPIGPPGVLKRRIYRTKNMGDQSGGAGSELYFLMDINDNSTTRVIDALPDTQLGSQAVADFERLLFPDASVGAVYGGRLVLGSIKDDPGTIYLSGPGKPEQFSAVNTFSLSSSYGGAVTALYPYNNLLLIFRESSIDALVQTPNGFQVVPVINNVGTLSLHSIQSVQGFGTVFLGHDRSFYVIQGNYSGGSSVMVKNISGPLGTKLLEINTSCLQRAFASYNSEDKEYWCHVPSKGQDICLDGFVFHTSTGGWSQRTNLPLSSSTVILEGKTLFGTLYKTYEDLTTTGVPRGLQCWTGLNSIVTRPTAVFETPWLSFGAPESIKRIESLVLYFYKNDYATANVAISASIDYRPYERAVASLVVRNSETSRPGILGTAVVDAADSSDYLVWDKNRYSSREVVCLRVAPNISTDIGYWENLSGTAGARDAATNSGVRWAKFKLTGNNDEIRFLGYSINYSVNGKILQYSSLEAT